MCEFFEWGLCYWGCEGVRGGGWMDFFGFYVFMGGEREVGFVWRCGFALV